MEKERGAEGLEDHPLGRERLAASDDDNQTVPALVARPLM